MRMLPTRILLATDGRVLIHPLIHPRPYGSFLVQWIESSLR